MDGEGSVVHWVQRGIRSAGCGLGASEVGSTSVGTANGNTEAQLCNEWSGRQKMLICP